MLVVERKRSREAYIPWLQQLQDFGEDVEVRGLHTKEFLNCATVITQPQDHCILIPSRRWNPFLALSEALWILAGRDDIKALLPYNSHIGDYSDDGVHLYGAYGPRIYHQIDDLVGRLRKDPNDRRAILQIWQSDSGMLQRGVLKDNDLTTDSKDPPCNQQVWFKLRQGKLHMTVTNRSNDLHFGLMAVNLPTFGILQSYIAARLGVEMGTQTHFSNSLHIYTDEPRAKVITNRMLYDETEDMPAYPEHENVFTDLTWVESHKQFAEMCSGSLDGYAWTDKVPFLDFGARFLNSYRNREMLLAPENMPHNFPQYSDWRLAANLFAKNVWGINEQTKE